MRDLSESAKKRGLHVDHDHGWKKVKINTLKMSDKSWLASATYLGQMHVVRANKKSAAICTLKGTLLPLSVRGLLCAHCNRGLRYYKDNPVFMEQAARYLRTHQGTLNDPKAA